MVKNTVTVGASWFTSAHARYALSTIAVLEIPIRNTFLSPLFIRCRGNVILALSYYVSTQVSGVSFMGETDLVQCTTQQNWCETRESDSWKPRQLQEIQKNAILFGNKFSVQNRAVLLMDWMRQRDSVFVLWLLQSRENWPRTEVSYKWVYYIYTLYCKFQIPDTLKG